MLTLEKIKALDPAISEALKLHPISSGSPSISDFSTTSVALKWKTPSNKEQLDVMCTFHLNKDGTLTHATFRITGEYVHRFEASPTPEPTPSTKKDKDKG